MQNTETKTNNSVKSKLVAAIAMLLVATIMVVSSTYAWFTLSTKPEVTGISTAVGANGALEMLLATKEGNAWVYHDGVVDTNATWKERNTYWGNLVNLSDLYGSEMITLYPSKLNVTNGVIDGTPISFPEYGADGRVNALQLGGDFGTYDGENFFKNDDFGFRALGTTSGMTARQQSFKVALAQVAINQSTAKAEARESLAANGTQLAAIAVKKGMGTSTEYDANDSAAVKAMATGIEKSLTALETAYLEALYTAVYSQLNTTATTDEEVANQITVIKAAANGKTALGEKIAAALAVADGVDASTLQGYTDFETAVSDFNTAKSAIDVLGETGTLTTLIDALRPLVDVDAVSVNGRSGSQISTDKSALATDIIANGAKVHIGNDGGVYGTIAELCGKYNVSIQIQLSSIDSSFTEGSLPADMTVGDNQEGTLNAVRTVLNGQSPTADGATNPISEFYGYVIDLAFRTNAANSNLLLQTAAADRIYGDNQNEETLGKGSTMTFNTDFSVFSEEQMKALMGNIKLVFFESNNTTDGMKIIKYAKLDADNAKKVDDGLEANIYLLDDTNNFITVQDDAVIQAMNTNQPTHVSVLVYLDGETLTNADVAATLAESMSGKLNLQFASSAELAPMDYADLHHKTTTENNGGNAQG